MPARHQGKTQVWRLIAVATLALAIAMGAASPGLGQSPRNRVFFRLTEGNWLTSKVVYDNDIACEAAGAPPSGNVADWLTHWSSIFQNMSWQQPDGGYTFERPDLYLNYIVKQRQKAGLPDFPKSFIEVIPAPPPHSKTPDWIEHPTYVVQHSGGPPHLICMPPKKAPETP
jgi:hypothetical protein